jgi:hypothetical protein
MTAGSKPRLAAAERGNHRIWKLDDFEGAGPVGQPADEAALFERGDQPVDARFGGQIQRILHLIERWRDAGFLHPFVDEHQQFVLLARQHWPLGNRIGT